MSLQLSWEQVLPTGSNYCQTHEGETELPHGCPVPPRTLLFWEGPCPSPQVSRSFPKHCFSARPPGSGYFIIFFPNLAETCMVFHSAEEGVRKGVGSQGSLNKGALTLGRRPTAPSLPPWQGRVFQAQGEDASGRASCRRLSLGA